MTPARPWFRGLARWYARRRVRSTFDGLHVSGMEAVRSLARERPLVLAANHVAWWDAFVILLLDEALGTDGICLMDAGNLGQLPFFGWLGAVPLRRDHPRHTLADLRASAGWLDRPGRAVWIFPQGEQRPSHLRPLGLRRGVGLVAGQSAADVVPVSITYAFRATEQPSIVVSLGEPCPVLRRGPPDHLERALIDGLDRNDAFLVSGSGAFAALVPSPRSRSVALPGRVLARLAGGSHG